MALSAISDNITSRNLDHHFIRHATVKAAVTVWKGGFYVLDNTGVVVVPSSTATDVPLGFALGNYAAGEVGSFQYLGQMRLPWSDGSIAVTDIETIVYASSDDTFTSVSTNNQKVGIVSEIDQEGGQFAIVDITLARSA